jgi:hypothetical protein
VFGGYHGTEMNQELLREISIEMEELETRFARDMEALRRKLRIALGDLRPRQTVVEFKAPNGKKGFRVEN